MTWLYNNQPVETLPEDCVGFVYMIINITNDRKYIGNHECEENKDCAQTGLLDSLAPGISREP
jgi:hypothetical protein